MYNVNNGGQHQKSNFENMYLLNWLLNGHVI